ncbi:MAG TPA: DUF2652 domain-containing protein [Flavitalea sp.]|nr:DUF2652 domain-containing protein [Flavitalea sp.]
MESTGLLFIPDISGFTKFVTESEINHSRLIIQELLEALINANQIGLEISEIEGDAILFYKFGKQPELEELYKQVEKMFCVFHKSLMTYDQRRYCQCRACISAADLSLKVITHYGEFASYNVKNFSKLIGKDVIVAHQLLKNNIEQHEYWLVTKNLFHDNPPVGFAEWMNWNVSTKETEAGQVHFHYTHLTQLKNGIANDPIPQLDLSKQSKICSFSKEYETDIITLFHAAGSFEYRHRWWDGVKKVEALNHLLPRVGMRSRWILDTGEVVNYSSSYTYTDQRIEFSESNDKNSEVTYFTLIKVEENKIVLTIDIYKSERWFEKLLVRPSRRSKLQQTLQKSMQNLVTLVKELRHIDLAC